jgi:hypothetical protein
MKDLLHSMFGGGLANATVNTATLQPGMLAQQAVKHSTNKKVFHGMVEVTQVANGYIVNIGRKEGYEYETHIASNITEVNEIIAAQIVAFKLEDKQ